MSARTTCMKSSSSSVISGCPSLEGVKSMLTTSLSKMVESWSFFRLEGVSIRPPAAKQRVGFHAGCIGPRGVTTPVYQRYRNPGSASATTVAQRATKSKIERWMGVGVGALLHRQLKRISILFCCNLHLIWVKDIKALHVERESRNRAAGSTVVTVSRVSAASRRNCE